jgi:hypothetical protein
MYKWFLGNALGVGCGRVMCVGKVIKVNRS